MGLSWILTIMPHLNGRTLSNIEQVQMETPYKPPRILRLMDVSLSDYVSVEDHADSNLRSSSVDNDAPGIESDIPHDKIPHTFTNISDWPYHTNLQCWQCGFTFSDRPKFVPAYVQEVGCVAEFGVIGNMCTFNCAELWIRINYANMSSVRSRAQDNLRLLYYIFTGQRVTNIKPAPCKTKLERYGGSWDTDMFWKKMRELDPIHGITNHTPGSVVPERERIYAEVLQTLRRVDTKSCAPIPRKVSTTSELQTTPNAPLHVSTRSMWATCEFVSTVEKPATSSSCDTSECSITGPDIDRFFTSLAM
jgi:hypothetical protein